MRKLYLAGMIVFILLLVTALGSIVQADEILGCYLKGHGQLRIVSSHNKCLTSENPITLSQSSDQSTYLGDFCSQITDGANVILNRLAVSFVGNGRYNISGATFKNGTVQNVLNGTAEEVDNKIHMNITSAGKDSEAMWNSTCYSVTDGPSFNSNTTYECIGHDYNYADLSLDTQYTTGYSTPVPCP